MPTPHSVDVMILCAAPLAALALAAGLFAAHDDKPSERKKTPHRVVRVSPPDARQPSEVAVAINPTRPDHGIGVRLAFRAFTGDLDAAERVLAARCLNEKDHAELLETHARRTAAGSSDTTRTESRAYLDLPRAGAVR